MLDANFPEKILGAFEKLWPGSGWNVGLNGVLDATASCIRPDSRRVENVGDAGLSRAGALIWKFSKVPSCACSSRYSNRSSSFSFMMSSRDFSGVRRFVDLIAQIFRAGGECEETVVTEWASPVVDATEDATSTSLSVFENVFGREDRFLRNTEIKQK